MTSTRSLLERGKVLKSFWWRILKVSIADHADVISLIINFHSNNNQNSLDFVKCNRIKLQEENNIDY